jgi:hypothetical protein
VSGPEGTDRFRAVPPELHSAYLEGPFRQCSDCGGSIESPDALHLIGKSWRGGDVVFEFALCMTCALSLFAQYSEESKRNLEAYFRPLSRGPGATGLSACVRCGNAPGDENDERNVEAIAMGGVLLDEPILVCGPCADGAEAVLSTRTKEVFDAFARRVCPTLPADIDLPAPIFSLP